MQYLKISPTDTLKSLSKIVGDRNVESILVANSIERCPNVGQAFKDRYTRVAAESPDVPIQRKLTLLNKFAGQSDLFENVATFSEDAWKVLSNMGTFPGALAVPETLNLPDSADVLGGAKNPVGELVYSKVVDSLKRTGQVNPNIFTEYSTINPVAFRNQGDGISHNTNMFNGFLLPWGKISLYSELLQEAVDFPCYPEELSDGYKANYSTMPDLLYQYEPWFVYDSSGPRTVEYTFTFHRDMWTGDHRDGMANKLIRFCQAHCFPRYSGSAVDVSLVQLFVGGKIQIRGILTEASTKWSGPIGLDGWHLVCELTLSITEVSQFPLDFDTVRSLGLIGR